MLRIAVICMVGLWVTVIVFIFHKVYIHTLFPPINIIMNSPHRVLKAHFEGVLFQVCICVCQVCVGMRTVSRKQPYSFVQIPFLSEKQQQDDLWDLERGKGLKIRADLPPGEKGGAHLMSLKPTPTPTVSTEVIHTAQKQTFLDKKATILFFHKIRTLICKVLITKFL